MSNKQTSNFCCFKITEACISPQPTCPPQMGEGEQYFISRVGIFFLRGPLSKHSRFSGYIVSVPTTQFCHYHLKTYIDK